MLIAAASYREVPWKNGGGLSYEIAVDDFTPPAWRISIARIDRSGPFSDYSGYDRTIIALDGSSVSLKIAGARLNLEPRVPYRFPGEAKVDAIVDGSACDLNVMTAREDFLHDVEIVDQATRFVLDEDEFAFVYAIDGAVAVNGEPCAAGDTVELEQGETFGVLPTAGAIACVIRITPV